MKESTEHIADNEIRKDIIHFDEADASMVKADTEKTVKNKSIETATKYEDDSLSNDERSELPVTGS